MHKMCRECGRLLPAAEFYADRSSRDGLQPACKQCRRAYQRRWMRERREAWFKDKACSICGVEDELEIHHRDPAEKVSHAVWSWSAPRREAELAKCSVLCGKCHRHLHRISTRYGCGTVAQYNRGCRCDACRTAHAARQRDYRSRSKRGELRNPANRRPPVVGPVPDHAMGPLLRPRPA